MSIALFGVFEAERKTRYVESTGTSDTDYVATVEAILATVLLHCTAKINTVVSSFVVSFVYSPL